MFIVTTQERKMVSYSDEQIKTLIVDDKRITILVW
jgi:hypothetical protein